MQKSILVNKELSYREKRIAELEDRRRLRASEIGPNFRLSVPEHLKDQSLTYRWANDDAKGNIYNRTQIDTWDFVTSDEIALDERNTGPGNRIERVVGVGEDGKPLKSYLVCKPKKWAIEDRIKRNKAHEEIMKQIHTRPVPLSGEQDLSADEEHAYIPREAQLPSGRAPGIRKRF